MTDRPPGEQVTFHLPPYPRGFHLVTHHVEAALPELPVVGLLHLFVQHTSAGLTLNENTDPTVRSDFASSFDELVPESTPYYEHTLEGPDDMPAHIKASLVGSSVCLPITQGRLGLGRCRRVFTCASFATVAVPGASPRQSWDTGTEGLCFRDRAGP